MQVRRARETRDAVAETFVADGLRQRVFIVESHATPKPMTYREAVTAAFAATSPTTSPWFASAHGNLGVIQHDGSVIFPDGAEPSRDIEGLPITTMQTCPMCVGHTKRISIETGKRDEACDCENGRVGA